MVKKMRTPEQEADFRYLCAIVDQIEHQAQKRGYSTLRSTERTVLSVWELQAQANNGGLHQYFFNTGGDHAADALRGLIAIGANKTAGILRRAMQMFPAWRPDEERFRRQIQLSKLAVEQFEPLDEEFYSCPEDVE